MWIDYVKIQNEPAFRLLSHYNDVQIPGLGDNKVKEWLVGECELAKDALDQGGLITNFYIEEFEINHTPCMKFVNHIIDSITNNSLSLMCNYNYDLFKEALAINRDFTPAEVKKYLVDYVGIKEIFTECYGLGGWTTAEWPGGISKTPWTLPIGNHPYSKDDFYLSYASDPTEYDDWLQENLDNTALAGTAFTLTYNLNHSLEIAKLCNIPFYYMPQAHVWWYKFDNSTAHKIKEPTNAEAEVTNALAVGYGAKGIFYFWDGGFDIDDDPFTTGGNEETHARGLINPGPNNTILPRLTNAYGENKWEHYKKLNEKLAKWGPTLMGFNTANVKSYKYQKECVVHFDEGEIGFFYDLKTYKPVDNSVDVTPINHETTPEPLSQRYLQVSFFNDPSLSSELNKDKYFMITNKRCSPYAPTQNSVGGPRFIKAKLNVWYNSTLGMNAFKNLNIIDIATNEVVATFYRDANSSIQYQNVDLGWFNPGEGKIFKIAPVLSTGGTLVGNEFLEAPLEFQCKGMVLNNGYDVFIPGGTKIRFSTNAGIEMAGGNLRVGYDGGSLQSEFTGINGGAWKGLKINWSSEASYLINTKIENVNAPYMVTAVNCPEFAMDMCTFNGSAGNNTGGVQIYNSNVVNQALSITGSYFNTYTNTSPAIKIMSYASEMNQIHIENNHITNLLNPGGGIGVLLNSTIGELNQNWITNFGQGVSASSSSLDLFGNTISSNLNYANVWGSPGSLIGVGNTVFNLSPAYNSYLGGNNNFSLKQGNCIWLDASYFNMAKGGNYLNIVQSDWRHLYGYFPFISDSRENATGNCFKINGRDPNSEADVKKYVIYADASTVDFDFLNFNCTPFNYDNFYVLDDGFSNDTIWTDGSGNGGGQSTISSIEDFSFKAIYDSMNINMRKKQYNLVEEKCKLLLEQYPDSGKTSDAVAKLYLATVTKDSSGNKTESLKSYYESYIQSHSGNTQLVQRIFYFIQKCKVRLNQYASAMQGFQTIMTQFPTTYDGLVAKWDYTATHLLDSISGSGGGEQSAVNYDNMSIEQQHNRLINLVDDPNDKYDKKKFTKEDRKVIVQNIVKSFETEKSKEVQKVKALEQKVINNEATKMEKSDYKSKSLLKTVVKTEVARTMDEHIDIVQKDLEKIFSLKEGNSASADDIPVVAYDYKLNQNYPNPFNPTTKINYQIKTPGFVSLKVYDLLGRTVAELVNERMEAGTYTVDFNASKYMLASGIYFYRIQAGEFVDTKRMVLVK